jgi:hypothetical protein
MNITINDHHTVTNMELGNSTRGHHPEAMHFGRLQAFVDFFKYCHREFTPGPIVRITKLYIKLAI